MPVEFIGLISTKEGSETHQSAGPVIQPDYVRRFARVHEDADFDQVLIGYSSASPDNIQVAAYAAANTDRLGYLIAHRPGVVFPTVAARYFATLDHFSAGRIAVHIITGGSDAEQRRDGDYLSKDERYARTDEYLEIVRRTWTATEPFDHSGRYYQLADQLATVRPVRRPHIPIYFGGSSEAAYRVGGRHADVYALWGEPLAETAEQIAAVNAAADAAGRPHPGISVSFRPILGPTEDLAWERAHQILSATRRDVDAPDSLIKAFRARYGRDQAPENVGSRRLLAAAAAGELHDRALWTPLAAATGAAGNSTALVGTPDTVAQALLDYVDIGVSTLLIRGYDPYSDAFEYGRDLIPLVREEVARRERGEAAHRTRIAPLPAALAAAGVQ